MVLNKIIIIIKIWIFQGDSNSLERTHLKAVLKVKAAKGVSDLKNSIRLM